MFWKIINPDALIAIERVVQILTVEWSTAVGAIIDKHISLTVIELICSWIDFPWYIKTRKFSVEMWRTSLSLSQSCHQLSNWTKRKTFKTKGQRKWNKQVDVRASRKRNDCVFIYIYVYLSYLKHFVSAHWAVKAFVGLHHVVYIIMIIFKQFRLCVSR